MKPTAPLRRSRVVRDTAVVVVVCAGLAAVMAAALWIVPWPLQGRGSDATQTRENADIRVGSVVVRLNNSQCRRMPFDNATGRFRDGIIEACDDSSAHRYGLSGDNIESLRDSFMKRQPGPAAAKDGAPRR